MEVEEALKKLEELRIKNYLKFKNKRYVLSYFELIGFTINTLKIIIETRKNGDINGNSN